jgi:transposase
MTASEELFVQQILEDRDRLFREVSKLKSQLSGYESFEAERTNYQQLLEAKDQIIIKLKQQVEILNRKIWGKSSERFINKDPLQRALDFEGLDLLPEEEELATSAREEIEQYKTIRVVEKKNDHPVRMPLPAHLPRVDVHIYPPIIDTENWTELEPEITEVLERNPPTWHVVRFMRHKYALKNKDIDVEKQIVIAPMPVLPIPKSYAGATVLADIIIDKYVNHLPFYRQIFRRRSETLPLAGINQYH